MTRKQVGRNTGNSGRINVSGPELDQLSLEVGDAVELDVADDAAVAHALIDRKDSERFLIVSPSN